MAPSIRRTENGTLEITTRFAKLVSVLLSVLMVLGALGWKAYAKNDKIENAVSEQEFQTHIVAESTQVDHAERRIEILDKKVDGAVRRSTAVSCYLARYPAGLCDDVPRQPRPGS